MNRPHYIFIGDQGRIFYSANEPTPEDFEFAAVGMVIIVRLADCAYYGREKDWRPIVEGVLGCADLEDESTVPFHSVEADFRTPALAFPNAGSPLIISDAPARASNLPPLGDRASSRLERSARTPWCAI
jgi:hypothetical protein